MRQHVLISTRRFLLAIALGGGVAMALTAAGVSELWSIVAGWVVFIIAGTAVGRRLHHRSYR